MEECATCNRCQGQGWTIFRCYMRCVKCGNEVKWQNDNVTTKPTKAQELVELVKTNEPEIESFGGLGTHGPNVRAEL